MKQILIAGCGDVGIATAAHFADATVYGLRRRPGKLPASIVPVTADLTSPDESFADAPDHVDLILYCPTPSERSEKGYRATFIDGVRNLVRACRARTWIFVSSTAVYGQDDGAWVDEDVALEPTRYNGRVLKSAERNILDMGGTVIRSAGIYGPGRDYLIRRVEEGVAARSHRYTNRIHRDDLAAAIAHLAVSNAQGTFNAVDSSPCAEPEVMNFIAERLGTPPPEISSTEPSNKRVSNSRLLNTGFTFTYPDYRAGYDHVIAHRNHRIA